MNRYADTIRPKCCDQAPHETLQSAEDCRLAARVEAMVAACGADAREHLTAVLHATTPQAALAANTAALIAADRTGDGVARMLVDYFREVIALRFDRARELLSEVEEVVIAHEMPVHDPLTDEEISQFARENGEDSQLAYYGEVA